MEMNVIYKLGSKVDVPVNYLNIGGCETAYGKLNPINLHNGMLKIATFMKLYYGDILKY